MDSVSPFGVLFMVIFYALSSTPSLLPRRWWWHAFVSGTLMGLGYTLGWAMAGLVSAILQAARVSISAPNSTITISTWVLVTVVAIWAIQMVVRSFLSSKRAATSIGMKPVRFPEQVLGMLTSIVMFAFVMTLVNLSLRIFRQLVHFFGHWLYLPLAWTLAAVLVVALVLVISNRVVFRAVIAYFARISVQANNRKPPAGLTAPMIPQRSGSPDSPITWESVGGQGRLFLGHGPSAQRIEEVTRRSAMEPVRAYVGITNNTSDLHEVAEEAVAELRRTGGFERSLILVNTATGSGWVDEWVVEPVEYLTGGDCATVSMQYSHMFSAALLVTNIEVCAEAGRALFQAVEREVLKMPRTNRPLLCVSGESLGAYGSQSAFTDLDDLNARVDGALWVGSPYKSHLREDLTAKRHRGSPEVSPVYDSGAYVRFMNEPQQLERDIYGRELGSWKFPRTVFAQHASDSVVWYNTSMFAKEPDWLRERAGLDVSPSMRFTPVVTFLQVIADLPVAGLAPPGHGHTYHRELIDAWAKILGFDQSQALGRLGDVNWLTPEMKSRIGKAVEQEVLRAQRKTDVQRDAQHFDHIDSPGGRNP